MNDHNLDDLIIDNIDPKTSKTKGFLTIIALAIVVLIVAIILTKIVLKDPNEKLVLDENDTEFISPELTLQPAHKETKTEKTDSTVSENLALSKPSVQAEAQPVPAKSETTKAPLSSPLIASDQKKVQQEKTRLVEEKAEQARIALEKEKIAAQKALEEKLQKDQLAKKASLEQKKYAAKQVVNSGYYIQVGSYTQSPSKNFLKIIKNSGFDYLLTQPSSNGAKKLLIGPYKTRAEVDTALVRVRDRINKSAFVVKK